MLDLGRTFLQSVERSPHQVAIVDGGLRLSYLEWARRIGAVQRGLADAGLARGDHLLVDVQKYPSLFRFSRAPQTIWPLFSPSVW